MEKNHSLILEMLLLALYDSLILESQHLEIWIYSCMLLAILVKQVTTTHHDGLNLLEKLGFKVNKETGEMYKY